MGKTKEPDVRQPNVEQQREYVSLRDNEATEVYIRRKKYRLRWLKKGQIEKLGKLLLQTGSAGMTAPKSEQKTENLSGADFTNALERVVEDGKLSCKAAAIYILDGYWKMRLKYWFLWRWFYYIRQYEDRELFQILAEGKKKVPQEAFLAVTILLTGARDTLMTMRTAEAERILQELNMEQPTQEQKSDNGSQPQDTSSSAQ